MDEFSSPLGFEPEFDNYGRYLLPHPVTGQREPWTRATTFADTVKDTFALAQWEQRMILKGVSIDRSIADRAATLDVKKNAKELNALAKRAKETAGSKKRAELGTKLHTYTELADSGRGDEVPAEFRKDVHAYRKKLESEGLTVVPEMIERLTCVTGYQVAGRLDEIVRLPDGTYVIGDKKTGDGVIKYAGLETSIQLAIYAHGVNESGVFNRESRTWEKAPRVRTDFGLVFHMPAGTGTCEIHRVDIAGGWELARYSAKVRRERKRKDFFAPWTGSPGWEVRFAAVSSRAEASALYREALDVLGEGPELDRLVSIGLKSLDLS